MATNFKILLNSTRQSNRQHFIVQLSQIYALQGYTYVTLAPCLVISPAGLDEEYALSSELCTLRRPLAAVSRRWSRICVSSAASGNLIHTWFKLCPVSSASRSKKLSYRRDSARCGCRIPQLSSVQLTSITFASMAYLRGHSAMPPRIAHPNFYEKSTGTVHGRLVRGHLL